MTMLKVMLIDDEAPFRTGLRELINWKQHGYEIIAEAGSGRSALELIDVKKPDIIIVDMNMPVMNGAELIEQVAAGWPKIKAIGLSGYDDYDYLRKTMRSGAIDYLLKHNLDADVLLTALNYAAQSIRQEMKTEALTVKIENQLEEHREALQQAFVNRLLNGQGGSIEEIQAQMDHLDLHLPLSGGSIILMLIDQFWRFKQGQTDEQIKKLVSSLLSISKEILREYDSSLVHQLDERTFAIFLPVGSQRSTMAILDRQNTVIRRTSSSITRYLNLSLSFCAGTPYRGIDELVSSYQQALNLMDQHFFDGSGSVIMASQRTHNSWQEQLDSISLDVDIEKKLISAIENGDGEAADTILRGYFEVLSTRRASNKSFKIICIELIHLLGRTVRDLSSLENDSYDPLDAYERINRFDTIDDLRDWILEKYQETVAFLRLHGLHERYSPVISRALQYIHTNYHKQISLGDVSEYAGVSNSYLSRSFKDETGTGFAEYMTNYRIEHACQMIKAGGQRIKDIAAACGFQNYTYFFKVFKQITGLTPNEYEAELIKKNR